MESLDISIPRQNSVSSDDSRIPESGLAGGKKAKLACRCISTGVFIAWIALMVTVVAEGGSPVTIIGVTLLPLLAHIVTVTVTAISLNPAPDPAP